MADTSITDLYIDDTVAFIPLAKLMPVAPAPSVCAHPQVDFGKPQDGLVRVMCLSCAHEWLQVRVLEPAQGRR